MSISGGHARVAVSEVSLDTRVPGFKGVYGAMVIPTSRGNIETPQLTTSESHFLKLFTPKQKVEIGMSMGYFSALAFLGKSNKLWIKRAIGDNFKYGGSEISLLSSGEQNKAWTEGVEDPIAREKGDYEAFSLYQADPGAWGEEFGYRLWVRREREDIILGDDAGNVGSEPATPGTGVLDSLLTITAAGGGANTNYTINLVAGAEVGATITGNTITVTIIDTTTTQQEICTALTALDQIATAAPTTPEEAWTLGTGTDTVTLSGGVDEANTLKVTQHFVSGEPVRFTTLTEASECPGGITKNFVYYTVEVDETTIKLAPTQSDAFAGTNLIDITTSGTGSMQLVPIKEVKEPGAFLIEIYTKDNLNVPVESIFASKEHKISTTGTALYIEEAFRSSGYIKAVDNVLTIGTPRPQIQVRMLAGGADGDPVTTGKMMLSADHYNDKAGYPVTVLMDTGHSVPAYQKYLDQIAASRMDCVAILSTPYACEDSNDYLNEIVDYRKNTLNLASSFSAIYTPHLKIYDKYNDRELYVAPDGYAGAAISYSAYNYEMWYPAAGFKRGKVEVLDGRHRFRDGELSYLYDNDINPIRVYPGEGIFIWGNKTLHGQPSSLDRLHVRLLLIVIEPAIAKALASYLFDLNTPEERRIVESMISDYMEGIKGRKGVYDFYTACNDDNNSPEDIDNYILNVDLFIKPTKDIEFINFRVILTKTGMSFQLAQEAV